jgi:DNA-binding NarL/FixJ family response regulator
VLFHRDPGYRLVEGVMNTHMRPGVATGTRKTVLIVGGDAIIRHGLAMIINHAPDFIVCGHAESIAKAIAAVAELQPNVALVNVLLDGSRGHESIKVLRSLYPALTIIASVHDEHLLAVQAMKLGASGFVMDENIIGSLRHVLSKVKTLPQSRTK